jgi:hypothetical protein
MGLSSSAGSTGMEKNARKLSQVKEGRPKPYPGFFFPNIE